MSTLASTTTETQARLSLRGGDADGSPGTATPNGPVATTTTVPLAESRALPLEPPTVADPQWWPQARGVPHYREFESGIDFADRPMGQNGVEHTFLFFMFGGVSLVGVSSAAFNTT